MMRLRSPMIWIHPPHCCNLLRNPIKDQLLFREIKNQQKTNTPKLDFETRNELRRKKLCFTCREPWTPDHRCLGKGKIHFGEVHSEEEEVEEPQEGNNSEDSEDKEVGGQSSKDKKKPTTEQPPVIATLSSDPACHPFRVKGVVRRQRIVCLLDIGASHNFISTRMVSRRGLQTVDIPEFKVKVAGGEVLRCTEKVAGL